MFNLFSKKSAKEESKSNDAKFEIVEDDEEEDSAFLKSLKLNLSRLIGIDKNINRLTWAKILHSLCKYFSLCCNMMYVCINVF